MLLVAAGFMAGRTGRPDPEIAQLHQEMTDLRNMVATSLVNQESAMKRIEGLDMASRVTDPDEAFLSLLVGTINTDTNVNVRLAAVDAIRQFTGDDWVRTELVKSLALQKSPLVQVSLIELLVDLREERALGVLRALADNEQSLDTVRKSARWGIQQMI